LIEALIATTDFDTVSEAKNFVRNLCLHELGPEELGRLQKLYRPPHIIGMHFRRKKRKDIVIHPTLRRTLLAQLHRMSPPERSEEVLETGRKIAKKRMDEPQRHNLDYFWWEGECPFHDGDIVIQITKENSGHRLVSPPGTVVYTKTWKRGIETTTFIYIELPVKRRISLEQLSKWMGSSSKGRLSRNGQVSKDFAQRLISAWRD
jgi:hypothetical protein